MLNLLSLLLWPGSGHRALWMLDGPTEITLTDYDTSAGLADQDTDCALNDYTTNITLSSLIVMKTLDRPFILSGTLSAQDPSTLPSWVGATAVLNLRSLDTDVVVIDAEAVTLNTTTGAWSISSATDVPAGSYIGEVYVTFPGPLTRAFPNFTSFQLQVIAAAGTSAS